MEQEIHKIYERLAALEKIHTRYTGDRGPKGDRGEPGPAGKDGRDGKDTTVEERNSFRQEINEARSAFYTLGRELREALQNDFREYLRQLGEAYAQEIQGICASAKK